MTPPQVPHGPLGTSSIPAPVPQSLPKFPGVGGVVMLSWPHLFVMEGLLVCHLVLHDYPYLSIQGSF